MRQHVRTIGQPSHEARSQGFVGHHHPARQQHFVGNFGQRRQGANLHSRPAGGHGALGARGTGKTGTARIIAKGMNCIGPDGKGGPTVEPCGQCEHCVAIMEGRHLDVLEMDGASQTKIDDMRARSKAGDAAVRKASGFAALRRCSGGLLARPSVRASGAPGSGLWLRVAIQGHALLNCQAEG